MLYPDEIQKLHKILDSQIRKREISNKKIICFGNNNSSLETIWYFHQKNIPVFCIFDNKSIGETMDGIPIRAPYYCEELKTAVILIGSRYFHDMTEQIIKLGFQRKQIFITLKYNDDIDDNLSYMTLVHKYGLMLHGYNIYKRLQKKYGHHTAIFISPAKSLGDAYLIQMYLRQSIELRQIKHYIFVVNGFGAMKVCELYKEENAVMLSSKEVKALCRFSRFLGEEKTGIYVLNEIYHYTNPTKYLILYGKYNNFSCFYKQVLFGLHQNTKGKPPEFLYRKEIIDQIFMEYKLVKGKTVVLSPYSNYLKTLPQPLWESLANELKNRGYTVCTNCCGKNEKPVRNTIRVEFEIRDAVPFVEAAGFFIGIRNGLCDIISTAKAKKVILYSFENESRFGTAMEYFGLKAMNLCEDVLELQLKSMDMQELLAELSEYFIRQTQT